MKLARNILGGLSVAIAISVVGCGDAEGPTAVSEAAEPSLELVTASAMPSYCDNGLHKRSPEEVLDSHRAALAAGDLDAAVCNYAPDAVVISDGGIDVGHDQIRSSLSFFLTIYDGTQPEVVQQIVTEVPLTQTHMVRLLFTIDTPCVTVPDGIDTYVIRQGLIHGQTAHGFPVFQCL